VRTKRARIASGLMVTLSLLICSQSITLPNPADSELKSGHCTGCMKSSNDSLFTRIVRTDTDFDSLVGMCFLERTRENWLPPRPTADEDLVYVSLKGNGCEGCLDIVNVRENTRHIVVEVEGGFQGACDMLTIRGAWMLIPSSDKEVIVEFREVSCSGDE
jgi:hypothetical protein